LKRLSQQSTNVRAVPRPNRDTLNQMKSKTLPAFCFSGRDMESIDGVVIHYFSGKNVDSENKFDLNVCRNLMIDLNRCKSDREHHMKGIQWPDGRMYASAHIFIGRDGETWKLMDFDKQAYHAGASKLNGRSNLNKWSIGIELIGAIDSGFTRMQYSTLAQILIDLQEAYGIPLENIAGHDEVRWNAIQDGSNKHKKYDPSGRFDGEGDNFDWAYLMILMSEQSKIRLENK